MNAAIDGCACGVRKAGPNNLFSVNIFTADSSHYTLFSVKKGSYIDRQEVGCGEGVYREGSGEGTEPLPQLKVCTETMP